MRYQVSVKYACLYSYYYQVITVVRHIPDTRCTYTHGLYGGLLPIFVGVTLCRILHTRWKGIVQSTWFDNVRCG
jgi:hypothetical protein